MRDCGRGTDGRLVIRGICDREVGQSGYADGRRPSDGSGGKYLDRVYLRSGDQLEWRRLKGLRFGISVGKP